MKASVPRLSPLLRSDTQGRILAALYLEPDRERTTTELAEVADTSVPNAHREVARLIEAGYVTARRTGRNRLIRVDVDNPIFMHVAAILRYAYGPLALLPSLLGEVAGVERAYIYGSWAARLLGESGPDPADIDVLVVGDAVDIDALIEFEDRARDALGREVNARAVAPAEWERGGDQFFATVRARPLVELPLGRTA